ncbi:MAG: hypothetical protein ACXIUW_02955 [Roseinatronobacter sp.]
MRISSRYREASWLTQLCCLVVLVWACLLGQPLAAYELHGSQDEDFSAALSLWLDNNEEDALPQLRDLAQASNDAAQMLLGLIDKNSALQGPFLSFLAREERIALLRAPGGLSGRNWITVLAEQNDLAKTWRDLWSLEGGVDIAQRFLDNGEARAAREALIVIASRHDSALPADVVSQEWYPDSLKHLTQHHDLSEGGSEHLHPGHPIRLAAGVTLENSVLREWLMSDPLGMPLRGVCDAQCSDNPGDCAVALYRGLASYHALLLLGSPIAALLTDEEFAETRRSRAAVARRIMLAHSARTRDAALQRLGRIDQCAADWLRGEFKLYYPRLRETQIIAD